jgi:hypothetical protein
MEFWKSKRPLLGAVGSMRTRVHPPLRERCLVTYELILGLKKTVRGRFNHGGRASPCLAIYPARAKRSQQQRRDAR